MKMTVKHSNYSLASNPSLRAQPQNEQWKFRTVNYLIWGRDSEGLCKDRICKLSHFRGLIFFQIKDVKKQNLIFYDTKAVVCLACYNVFSCTHLAANWIKKLSLSPTANTKIF